MNNVANAAEMTVAEVQAKHMEAIKSQKVEMVPAHELFGFSNLWLVSETPGTGRRSSLDSSMRLRLCVS